MSDAMWNDPPYKFGDWKKYAVHDEKQICGFFGEYKWLSNFQKLDTPITYDGNQYFYVENAYMAAKSLDKRIREEFINLTPSKAKIRGREIELRPDWENVKLDFMFIFNYQKYIRNVELREKILATGDRYLEETNHWKDSYFGYDIIKGGENHLGKILMRIRSLLK